MDLRKYVARFIQLSLPIKLVISSFVLALGGSTLLGFVAELASYQYAYTHGARIPLEGLPFLRFNVMILSLATFFSAVLVFFIFGSLISGTIKYGVAYTAKGSRGEVIDLQTVSLKKFLGVGLFVVAPMSQLFAQLSIFFPEWWKAREWYITTVGLFGPPLVLLYTLRFQHHAKYVLISFYVVIVGFVIYSLFDNENYTRLLKELKYGGEMDVYVTYNCGGKTCETSNYKLFLRTAEYFILKKGDEFIEVPKNSVIKIIY